MFLAVPHTLSLRFRVLHGSPTARHGICSTCDLQVSPVIQKMPVKFQIRAISAKQHFSASSVSEWRRPTNAGKTTLTLSFLVYQRISTMHFALILKFFYVFIRQTTSQRCFWCMNQGDLTLNCILKSVIQLNELIDLLSINYHHTVHWT